MVLFCYSILPYSTWKYIKKFKCMHISNEATFEEVTQVCSYSQQKNITLWMLEYERSTSLEMMVPKIGEVWNDAADWW